MMSLEVIALGLAAAWAASLGVAYMAGIIAGFGRAERLVRSAQEGLMTR